MNTNISQKQDLAAMTLDELIALRQMVEVIRQENAETLQALRGLEPALVDAKNVADDAKTKKDSLWQSVFALVVSVFESTREMPQFRHMVFSDTLAEFIEPKRTESGDKLPISTVGQYASTGRKFLLWCTEKGEEPADYADKQRPAIMDAMKDAGLLALLVKVKNASKTAGFIMKHGDMAERKALEALFKQIDAIQQPVKARKEGKKAAAVATKELQDLRQQHPAQPATVEAVAANIAADEDEAIKQAVNA